MTTQIAPKPKPRERIIAAAARLFLAEGIHAVGVDHLSKEAKVSKRSLYQHFHGKYDVLEAALDDVGPRVLARYIPADGDTEEPLNEILEVFRALEELSRSDRFVGCPFVNIATELRDPNHPSAQQARRFKRELTEFFEHQALRLSIVDPEMIATQLTMLFDGASAYAVVQGVAVPPSTRRAVEALVRDASLRRDV